MKCRPAVNCWLLLLLITSLLPPPVLAQSEPAPAARSMVTVQADFVLKQEDTAEFKSVATLTHGKITFVLNYATSEASFMLNGGGEGFRTGPPTGDDAVSFGRGEGSVFWQQFYQATSDPGQQFDPQTGAFALTGVLTGTQLLFWYYCWAWQPLEREEGALTENLPPSDELYYLRTVCPGYEDLYPDGNAPMIEDRSRSVDATYAFPIRVEGQIDPTTGKGVGTLTILNLVNFVARDEWGTKEEVVATLATQLQLMTALEAPRRRVAYDPAALRQSLPESYKIHLELEWDNGDYIDFLVRRRLLIHQAETQELLAALAQAQLEEEYRFLYSALGTKEIAIQQMVRLPMARLHQLQARARLVARDYNGAVYACEQAAQVDPQLVDPANCAALKGALNWEKSKESGVEFWRQLGNQGIYRAYFGAVFQRPIPASGPTLAFTGRVASFGAFVWETVNPFASLTRPGDFWKNLSAFASETAEELAEQPVSQGVGQLLAAISGASAAEWEEYADLVAGILVEKTGDKVGSFIASVQSARELRRVNAEIEQIRARNGLVSEALQRRRTALADALRNDLEVIQALDKLAAAENNLRQLIAQNQANSVPARQLRNTIRQHEEAIADRTNPINQARVELRLREYQAALATANRTFDPEAAHALLRRLPLLRLRWLKAKGELPPALEQAVDDIRHALVHYAQEQTYIVK